MQMAKFSRDNPLLQFLVRCPAHLNKALWWFGEKTGLASLVRFMERETKAWWQQHKDGYGRWLTWDAPLDKWGIRRLQPTDMSETAWSIVGDSIGHFYVFVLFCALLGGVANRVVGDSKGTADAVLLLVTAYFGGNCAHIVLRVFHHYHLPHYRFAVSMVNGIAVTMMFVALSYIYDTTPDVSHWGIDVSLVSIAIFTAVAYAIIRNGEFLEPRYVDKHKRRFLDRMTDHHINNQISPLLDSLEKGDVAQAKHLALALATEYRFAGRRFESPTQALSEEFASAKNRMAIACFHCRNAIAIFNQDTAAASLTVPTELLQPLIENALDQARLHPTYYLGIFVRSHLTEEQGDSVLTVEVLSANIPKEWVDADVEFQQAKASFAHLLDEVRTEALSRIEVSVEEPEDGLPLTAEAAHNLWGRRASLYAGEIPSTTFEGPVPPHITRLQVSRPT